MELPAGTYGKWGQRKAALTLWQGSQTRDSKNLSFLVGKYFMSPDAA